MADELPGVPRWSWKVGANRSASKPTRAFAYWDSGSGDWVAEPGEFELLVGASSRDLRARASVTLEPA